MEFGGDPECYVAGTRTPAPPVTRWSHHPKPPLHKVQERPKLRVKGPAVSHEDSDSYVAPVTMRSLRKSFIGRPLTPEDDAMLTLEDKNSPRKKMYKPIAEVPTAEEVEENAVQMVGLQSLHAALPRHIYRLNTDHSISSSPRHSFSKPKTSRAKAKTKAQAVRVVKDSTQWSISSPAGATGHSDFLVSRSSPSPRAANDKRLYRSDLEPTEELLQAAMEEERKKPVYDDFQRRGLCGIPDLNSAEHRQLLEAIEKDAICAKQKEHQEEVLRRRAAIYVSKATNDCDVRRGSLFHRHQSDALHILKPQSKSSMLPPGAFPVTARLMRVAERSAVQLRPSSAAGGKSATMRVAPSEKTVEAILQPSFVIPLSRRYGSNKFSEAPKAKMAYEAEADPDSTNQIERFELITHRALDDD